MGHLEVSVIHFGAKWNANCPIEKKILPIFVTILKCTLSISFVLMLFGAGQVGAQNVDKKSSSQKTDSVAFIDVTNKSTVELINLANSKAIASPVKSMGYATAALEKSIAENDKNSQARCYNTLATLYYNSGNYSAASKYFGLASGLYAELKDPKNKAYSDKYLAASNSKLEALYKKEAGYEKSFKKTKSKVENKKTSELKYRASQYSDGSPEKIDIYNELGTYYLENKDTVQAISYMNQAASNSKVASDAVLFSNSSKISGNYLASGNYQLNLQYQNGLVTEGIKRGSDKIVTAAKQNIATTYLETDQPNRAIPFLKESIQLANKSQDIEQKQKSVKELARAYENLGQYDKALSVIKDYVHTMDSLQSLQVATTEANIALNEEFSKQEARIQKLIVTQKQKEADYRKQRNIVWGLGLTVLVFGILTWMLVRNIRQKQTANMKIRLGSLRTQMNPHFIFNSLNSVNNYISKNDERSANRYLADFSKLMRSVLKNSDQDFVGLETEMETLRIYLELEHFRFGDKFDYTIEVADGIDTDQVQVPPMLIQPYIENAIWHGLRYKETKGKLEVKLFTDDDKLYCTVRDNGIGRVQSAALKTRHQKTYQSTGIKNTTERIELLNKMHGTKLNIAIFDLTENGKPDGTLVKMSLPYIMQLEEV